MLTLRVPGLWTRFRRLLKKAGCGRWVTFGIQQLLAEEWPRNGAVTKGSGCAPSSAAC